VAEVLEALVARLTIPGLPSWVGLVILVAIAVTLLAFLAMPFSVFGVKTRLEAVEAELGELRSELRALLRQLPAGAPAARTVVEEDYVAPRVHPAPRPPEHAPRTSPPVPPPAARPARGSLRAEPRLDWPRPGG